MTKKLKELIGFDYHSGEFVIGSHDIKGNAVKDFEANRVNGSALGEDDVNGLLRQMAVGGADLRAEHDMLAAAIVEPIQQVVEYVEMFFPTFFMSQSYGPLEDNRIPVEDLPVLAWQTTDDAAVLYTRAGFTWTRPDFVRFDTGIEVNWYDLEKAGWNYLARQMKYAAWELAKKRDALGQGLIDTALLPSHIFNITGGLLTKAAVDGLLKFQAGIGYPIQRALVNPGRLMDMAGFNWSAPQTFGTGFTTPPEMARELVRTLYVMDYGGAQWFTNVNMSTASVYFSSAPSLVGWHQTRGEVRRASDIDITNKRDIHAIIDQEHAGFVGNANGLAKIGIAA